MIAQRSPEWYAQRLGKATASRIADIVAKTKTGVSTSRANYAAELIAERVGGTPAPNFVSGPMQWGIDQEAAARALYADRCRRRRSRCGIRRSSRDRLERREP